MFQRLPVPILLAAFILVSATDAATKFSVPRDKVVVCSDDINNICVAETDCNRNGQVNFDPGQNIFVGPTTQRDGMWTIVGGYTIDFPSECDVTCKGDCICDDCAEIEVSDSIITADSGSASSRMVTAFSLVLAMGAFLF